MIKLPAVASVAALVLCVQPCGGGGVRRSDWSKPLTRPHLGGASCNNGDLLGQRSKTLAGTAGGLQREHGGVRITSWHVCLWGIAGLICTQLLAAATILPRQMDAQLVRSHSARGVHAPV